MTEALKLALCGCGKVPEENSRASAFGFTCRWKDHLVQTYGPTREAAAGVWNRLMANTRPSDTQTPTPLSLDKQNSSGGTNDLASDDPGIRGADLAGLPLVQPSPPDLIRRDEAIAICKRIAEVAVGYILEGGEPDHNRRRESMEAAATRVAAELEHLPPALSQAPNDQVDADWAGDWQNDTPSARAEALRSTNQVAITPTDDCAHENVYAMSDDDNRQTHHCQDCDDPLPHLDAPAIPDVEAVAKAIQQSHTRSVDALHPTLLYRVFARAAILAMPQGEKVGPLYPNGLKSADPGK